MSRDLHMAAYYLHPAYHYAFELSYEDHLIAAFTRVVERLLRSPLKYCQTTDALLLESQPPQHKRRRVGYPGDPRQRKKWLPLI
ncbi:hypothetical protein Taro_048986 [Colocasia esculenta]|uniref:Uncharacterized protein n=1 Tax=Colocasia esculenta TaxID=4460 RepID=A0A843X9P8_COLES|nr:hypothetical protein [Colocasia esculenta]